MNYFKTYLNESTEGSPRKYYSLAELGDTTRIELAAVWYNLIKKVNRMIILKNRGIKI
ncbi:MAG: hypothetical protein JJE29_09390 [Peptostreptococcaceae bacterium]|nr:hypothetical protein [Peptostreptococcaceae bacterium]